MSKKLHILFINSWYPSRVLPTNGDFIQRHAEAVSIKNTVTAIHIISDENCNSPIDITDEIINEVRTIIGYVKFTKNPVLKYFRFIKAFRKISKKLKDFDIVHLNRIYPLGIFALYLKYFKKKPFIASEHWTDYKPPLSEKIGFTEKYVSKLITKNASFICPVTDDLKNSMLHFGLKGNYVKVPNVVDTSLFNPSKTEISSFTLIHISNMIDAHKNVTSILRTFAKINKNFTDIKIKLIGSNVSYYNDTIKKLKINSDNIETFHHISQQELTKHIKNANLLILFSNYENLPCVILEAFSCGIPVISTDVGGIKEYFPENFGKLIAVKDEKELENTIAKFYNKKYSIANKDTMHQYVVSNFSKEQISSEFTNLYHKTLEE